MKTLTLIRHAKSSWKDASLRDFDRPLNKRGKRDAPDMGERLAGRDVRPDAVVSSPARRAVTTARVIAEKLGFPPGEIILEDGIYEAWSGTLISVIRSIDDAWDHVVIVGHNPGFTDLGNLLEGDEIDNIPTCGVLSLDLDVKSWREVSEGSGRRVFYDYPKKVRE